jgi:hypothetical protein
MLWSLKEDAIVPVEFNEVLSAITGNFKGSGAVDSPVAFPRFGSLRTIFYHFRFPALIWGDVQQPVYREIFWIIKEKKGADICDRVIMPVQ